MFEIDDNPKNPSPRPLPNWILPTAAGLLGVAALWSGLALVGERKRVADLMTENTTLSASLKDVQAQVKRVSNELDSVNTALREQEAKPVPVQAAQPESIPQAAPKPKPVVHRAAQPKPPAKPVTDPRVDQLQEKLNEQEQELAATRQQIDQNRKDLEGNLASTRDELNGSIGKNRDSIARTHDELVELQKRGERNYYEFRLDKSKTFQKVGPLSLHLRKVDAKKRSYDFEMMVEDHKLQKKNVLLYEPVTIVTPERGQSLQLVVNEVNKDVVKGYVSEPKFKVPQLAATTPSKPPELQQRP